MSNKQQERTLALAGVFEAASLVASLAKTGQCDINSFNALTNSLFIFDPKSTLDVYGNDPRHLYDGLTILSQLSANQIDKKSTDIIRYAISLLALQKQLGKHSEMLNVIRSRLNHTQYNKTHFSDDESQLASAISGLYQDTISTLKFRIHVNGHEQYLKQESISNKIRTLLLAGIRSAMLWRQLGGTKWQIIFGRGDIEKTSQALLAEIKNAQH
jgi:high frequency lysogenization protein